MNTQNRDNAIDIAKGIGILLVIVGHTGGLPADTAVHHFIYSFHMPLFFILGGYFFKPSGFKKHLLKDARRLLLPYAFSVFLLILWFILLGAKYDNYGMVWRTLQSGMFGSGQIHASPIWGDYPTIGMIWFLLAMFWCRVTYNIVSRLSATHRFLTSAVIAMAATVIDNFIINMPFGILTGLSAIMFYMLGKFAAGSAIMQGTFINELCIVGGVLIISSGLSLLKVKDCKTLNYLPALLIPPVWFLVKSLF